MKVLWLTNIPSPYRVSFFDELGKHCDLTVLFERGASDERDESWKQFSVTNFKAIFLKGISTGVAESLCPSVVKYLKQDYDHIVITNFSDLTGALAILYLRLKRKSYELESDGAFPGNGKGWKEKIKRFLIKGANKYFSTAELHDCYYQTYGGEIDRIVRYPFTSVWAKDVLQAPVSREQKIKLRTRLGMTEEHVVLAVGQFIHRKGFDILIKAAARLSDNVGIYIVGGKETEEYARLRSEYGVENIHFREFVVKEKLMSYYEAADLFVHPTREDIWGLVVNEALAKGIPVITTNRCVAGLQLIKDNYNGFIVEVENELSLAEAIKMGLNNEKMCIGALESASQYTLEKMAASHMGAWTK